MHFRDRKVFVFPFFIKSDDDFSPATRSTPENSDVLQIKRVKIWIWMSHFDSLFPVTNEFPELLESSIFSLQIGFNKKRL